MKKIFYIVGVYTTCVFVHDILCTIGRRISDRKKLIDFLTGLTNDEELRKTLYEKYDIKEEEENDKVVKLDRMGF